ncbi:MAG: prephenate dehydrogenase [Candidatus Omnitrophota bacterium]
MRLFNKVAIVGTGLIGGSIALAIRNKHLANEVIGVSRRNKNIRHAKKIGAIDRGSRDLNIIRDADLIILATPVEVIIRQARKISKIVRKDCLITDVGSTKVKIVKTLSRIFPGFIGSHPLAGSERTSIVQAHQHMFEKSLCILTPTARTSSSALNKIKILWQRLGARTVLMTADNHDRILSFISHLPHVAAFSLMGIIPKEYLRFAASGLKDTTRIACSDSELWAQVLLSNRRNMLESIQSFEVQLSRIKSAIRNKNKKSLKIILEKARKRRSILERNLKSQIPNYK